MPLNIDWQQILLHMFNFVLLFGLLYFILYKPVHRWLEDRRAADEEALRHRQENERLAAEAQEHCDELRRQADESLTSYEQQRRQEIDEQIRRELAEARDKADRLLADARKTAAADRQRMLDSAREEIARMAGDLARRIGADSTSDAFDRFLGQVEEGSGEHEE